MEPPKVDSKSRFHAGVSYKSRPDIAWNSCSRQVYPNTLNARFIWHAITQFSYPIPVFKLWNMFNNAITFSPGGRIKKLLNFGQGIWWIVKKVWALEALIQKPMYGSMLVFEVLSLDNCAWKRYFDCQIDWLSLTFPILENEFPREHSFHTRFLTYGAD